MTRQGAVTPRPAVPDLVADVQGFSTRFRIAEDGPAVTTELLGLLSKVTVQGKQIHDANIVATMLAHDIHTILTHNTIDFARYGGWINVIPLIPPPPPAAASPPPPPGAP
jgi:hypothetical protein